MRKTPTAARFEPSTRTIRSVPENYWLASIDSWDGAVDHEATALIFAASFEMLAALEFALPVLRHHATSSLAINESEIADIERIVAKAKGQS